MVAANDDQPGLRVELPGIRVGIAVWPMNPSLPHGGEYDETLIGNQERCLNMLIDNQLIFLTDIQVSLPGASERGNVKEFPGTKRWVSGLCPQMSFVYNVRR